jgi:hypothetical protein
VGKLIPFRPILAFFIWGATARLLLYDASRIPFDTVIGDGAYTAWMTIGFTAPLLTLLAWWLISHRPGGWRYRGLWFRLAADCGLFGWLLAYHVTVWVSNPLTESRIPGRYVVAAAMMYMLAAIAASGVELVRVERAARG